MLESPNSPCTKLARPLRAVYELPIRRTRCCCPCARRDSIRSRRRDRQCLHRPIMVVLETHKSLSNIARPPSLRHDDRTASPPILVIENHEWVQYLYSDGLEYRSSSFGMLLLGCTSWSRRKTLHPATVLERDSHIAENEKLSDAL